MNSTLGSACTSYKSRLVRLVILFEFRKILKACCEKLGRPAAAHSLSMNIVLNNVLLA